MACTVLGLAFVRALLRLHLLPIQFLWAHLCIRGESFLLHRIWTGSNTVDLQCCLCMIGGDAHCGATHFANVHRGMDQYLRQHPSILYYSLQKWSKNCEYGISTIVLPSRPMPPIDPAFFFSLAENSTATVHDQVPASSSPPLRPCSLPSYHSPVHSQEPSYRCPCAPASCR